MNCALITVGDEILIGQVTDTNVVWISRQLAGAGVRVGEMVTVPDDASRISRTLDRLMGKYDLIIMTGGLGPTKDDITKQTLADYFGSELVTNPEALDRITRFFKLRGRQMLESNLHQADVPEGCEVLTNEHGTAPGMWFEKEGTILVSLPGVPYEMKQLMEDQVMPRLRRRIRIPYTVHRTVMTQGVPESYLAALLRNWEAELPSCVKLAYLPSPGIVRLRLTVHEPCTEEAEQILKVNIDKLLGIIPEHIFGFDDISLEEALGQLLREQGLTIATAESCTGGNVARMITSVPESSDYFTGSIVAYHNRIKTGILKVDESAVARFGAVSREVAEQMASGVKRIFGTDCAIATTGIAGPGGGTADKPVGTTWIAVAAGERIYSRKFLFGGSRERIITQASCSAIQLLRQLILKMI
ncbi:MAG TPA: competence/damage-inducible protein A [Bacteroides sp.]|nr:competence/damage-inducible protein A [Bacteroides sp.]